MNTTTLSGRLTALKGAAKRQWGRLTDDDLARWDGRRETLIGTLKQRYGEGLDALEDAIERFFSQFRTDETSPALPSNLLELKGRVRKAWGKLTDDDLARWKGRRDELLSTLQERYEEGKAAFEDKVDELLAAV
jgi:uncharacterized protein YjbJ (UPF0337 family)